MNYDIILSYDGEAGVWCAVCDDIPLALEDDSYDTLVKRTKIVAYEVLEINERRTENVSLNMVSCRGAHCASAGGLGTPPPIRTPVI